MHLLLFFIRVCFLKAYKYFLLKCYNLFGNIIYQKTSSITSKEHGCVQRCSAFAPTVPHPLGGRYKIALTTYLEMRLTAPLAVLGGKNSREKKFASAWILSLILSIKRLYLYVGRICGVGGRESNMALILRRRWVSASSDSAGILV